MITLAAPVASLTPHALLVVLLQVCVLLTAAILLGRAANRCGLPPIVGELASGIVLGPSLLDRAAPNLSSWLFPTNPAQFHLLDAFATIGLLLMVGVTGAHMDTSLIRRQRRTALGISTAGLIIPLILGTSCGLLLPATYLPAGGDRIVFSAFLGVALAVSAIPVIAKTLADMRLLHRDIGQLILTTGTIDDAAAWVLLSIASAAATSGIGTDSTIRSLASLMLAVASAIWIVRPLAGAALRKCAAPEQDAVRTGFVIVLILGCAAGTQALGLEATFGAFVAGIAIAASGGVALADLLPLRALVLGVLAPVYFASVGLRIDLTSLATPASFGLAALILVLAMLGKFLGAFLGARLSRLDTWQALALGAGMNARGVVEVVIATVGLNLGVFDTRFYTIVVLVALVTSITAPPLLRAAVRHLPLSTEEQTRAESFGWTPSPAGESPAGER